MRQIYVKLVNDGIIVRLVLADGTQVYSQIKRSDWVSLIEQNFCSLLDRFYVNPIPVGLCLDYMFKMSMYIMCKSVCKENQKKPKYKRDVSCKI